MNHGSLFSGIEGFGLAARRAGIETVWQVENDPYCQKVLAKHFPKAKRYGDIKTIKSGDLEPVDIISGGFPCQPFSCAGKRGGTKDDRFLWPEMLRIISEVRPTWVIAENVPGIINMELDQVLADLESQDYEVQTFIIPACAVNAPHRRDRVWIIANIYGVMPTKYHSGFQSRHNKSISEKNDNNADCHVADTARRKRLQGYQNDTIINDRQTRQEHSGDLVDDTDPNSPGSQIREMLGRNLAEEQSAAFGNYWQEPWPEVAARLCGMDDGISNRVDRLRALGNSIVPQVAFQFFKMIKKIEEA